MPDSPRIECFISYAEMVRDAESWAGSSDFDDIAAVCGVPRSGCIVAGIIAAHKNTHVLTVDDVQAGRFSRPPLRRGKVRMTDKPIMVIEDTVRGGTSIGKIRARLGTEIKGRKILYGSLYARTFSKIHVDFYGKIIPRWSTFQWNWKQDDLMKYTMIDMDGVIHPENQPMTICTRPIFQPTIKIRAIVTGRGEHLRDKTEAWLKHWNIDYGRLFMAPSCEDARDDVGGPAGHKASIYRKDENARLFVESSVAQAKKICTLTGRPVLCTDRWTLYAKN